MKFWNPDELQQAYSFKPPVYAAYALTGFAIARLHAFLLITCPWIKPLLVFIWGVLCILALLTALSCWYRHSQKVHPLGEDEMRNVLIISVITFALVAGYAIESAFI